MLPDAKGTLLSCHIAVKAAVKLSIKPAAKARGPENSEQLIYIQREDGWRAHSPLSHTITHSEFIREGSIPFHITALVGVDVEQCSKEYWRYISEIL